MSIPDAVERLPRTVEKIKKMVLETCVGAGCGHVNSSLSCVDILCALYHGGVLNVGPGDVDNPSRDRFILSKGQASPALYAVLADLEYFPRDWLDTFAKPDGKFGVHLQNDIPGVEMSTGSLGHGLGFAAGLAYAARLQRADWMTYCLLGDAECYEGSVWEAAMWASGVGLNNLVAIIDRNSLGATDFTERMCGLEDLEDKWLAFGWDVHRIPGHDVKNVWAELANTKRRVESKPVMIICDTVKGNGISFMENAPLWHSRTPTGAQADQARKELGYESA